MSNYPPGFGSARDLDYVEGPLSEEELETPCPRCGLPALIRQVWRLGPPTVDCGECEYHRDDPDDSCLTPVTRGL